jgi:hypothetical protein
LDDGDDEASVNDKLWQDGASFIWEAS